MADIVLGMTGFPLHSVWLYHRLCYKPYLEIIRCFFSVLLREIRLRRTEGEHTMFLCIHFEGNVVMAASGIKAELEASFLEADFRIWILICCCQQHFVDSQ